MVQGAMNHIACAQRISPVCMYASTGLWLEARPANHNNSRFGQLGGGFVPVVSVPHRMNGPLHVVATIGS